MCWIFSVAGTLGRHVLSFRFQSAGWHPSDLQQQGDPLGPSLFALAIHPCIVEAARVAEARHTGDLDYKAFFLDDGVLAGKAPAVQLFLSTL